MCGINGNIRFDGNSSGLQELVSRMNAAQAHRGPDGSGIWQHQNHALALGHTRLSILDLSEAGAQPMPDSLSQNVISFNGEIYNYRELNAQYLKGVQFQSGTDTETILHLYRLMGTKAFALLNGMFAFALWDEQKQELYLVRDQLGKKPLYVLQKNQQVLFASEIKGLFADPSIEKKLDEKALYDWLTFNMALTPATLFEGIHKLEPGTFLCISIEGKIRQENFARPSGTELPDHNPKKLETQLLETLDSAVNWRMRSDVPVGLFLSGGVDSSAILALMSRYTEQAVSSFSIAFEGQANYNETDHAAGVAKQFGSSHHVEQVKADDLIAFMPQITQIYDEPQADTTAIPIYFLSRAAKEAGIKVILNGDGADELFAGYRSYLPYARLYPYYNALLRIPAGLRKQLLKPLLNSKSSIRQEMAERAMAGQAFFWSGASGIRESQKKKMLSDDFLNRNQTNSYHYIESLRQDYLKLSQRDDINWMCYSGLRQAVTENFLFRADRLGMAHGVEARSPFLDDRMVNLALSIPGKLKIKQGEPKYLVKKALEPVLSKEVLYRKKMGFCTPLREWAGNTIIGEVESIYQQFCSDTGIFRPEAIKQALDQFKAGKDREARQIWTIYFFMQWHKTWL